MGSASSTFRHLPLACAAMLAVLVGGCTAQPDEGGADDGASDDAGDSGGSLDAPTWHADIHPLTAKHCEGCHRDGGIGPFSVETYEEAKQAALDMLDAIETGYMPPWHAVETETCDPPHGWIDDARLSDDEKALFAAWVAADTPEGDPSNPTPVPEPPDNSLQNVDETHVIPGTITIDGSADQYECWVIDLQNDTQKFLRGISVVPGNELVAHHVLVYSTTSDEALTLAGPDGRYTCFGGPGIDAALTSVWAPGMTPQIAPEGAAFILEPNTKLVLQMHYHPTGTPETDDDTAIEFELFDGLPSYYAFFDLVGNYTTPFDGTEGLDDGPNDGGGAEFRIPAGARDHTERMLYTIPPELPPGSKLFGVGSHMHYVGVSETWSIRRAADDSTWCALSTPKWDFNWQRVYHYDTDTESLPDIHAGDLVTVDCAYDNSTFNPFVAEALDEQGLDAPVDVFMGESTLDEMCLAVAGVLIPL